MIFKVLSWLEMTMRSDLEREFDRQLLVSNLPCPNLPHPFKASATILHYRFRSAQISILK